MRYKEIILLKDYDDVTTLPLQIQKNTIGAILSPTLTYVSVLMKLVHFFNNTGNMTFGLDLRTVLHGPESPAQWIPVPCSSQQRPDRHMNDFS